MREVGLAGLDIIDRQCGCNFFQGAVARDFFQRQRIDGYMVDAEILVVVGQRGYRIQQVPVCWRHRAVRVEPVGESHLVSQSDV